MGEILVDTSVWLDYFRSESSPYTSALDDLLQQEAVCTARIIMAEIVPGARTSRQFQELGEYFRALPLVEEPPSMWEKIMDLQFRLNRSGVNGMSIPDLIIAVLAHSAGKKVFTKDKDFDLIRKVLPLDLYGFS